MQSKTRRILDAEPLWKRSIARASSSPAKPSSASTTGSAAICGSAAAARTTTWDLLATSGRAAALCGHAARSVVGRAHNILNSSPIEQRKLLHSGLVYTFKENCVRKIQCYGSDNMPGCFPTAKLWHVQTLVAFQARMPVATSAERAYCYRGR